MSTFIYHERQESKLCGQHCLNNLLQSPIFSAPDLGDIAADLDKLEKQYMCEGGVTNEALNFFAQESGNVDESGNFSVQVLRTAVKRSHNIDLVSWASKDERQNNPTNEQAFIVNRSDHWFTIRKIGSSWWNLNSCLDLPELISEFYLSAFLSQLRNDNYSVFIARGNIPDSGSPFENENPYGFWHKESDLRGSSSFGSNKSTDSKPAFTPFSGNGRRLQDKISLDENKPAEFIDITNIDQYDEDAMLAAAIKESLKDSSDCSFNTAESLPVLSEKEASRNKRLAALEKRGFN